MERFLRCSLIGILTIEPRVSAGEWCAALLSLSLLLQDNRRLCLVPPIANRQSPLTDGKG
jgi:hypothetical protein